MIENAIKYVKQIFADDCSGHDDYHTMRVYHLYLQEMKHAFLYLVRSMQLRIRKLQKRIIATR